MLQRIENWLLRKLESRATRAALKRFKPTGADSSCDASCSYCGTLCPHCGRAN